MAGTSQQVERYFDRQADQWDSLYDKNRVTHALNQKLRRGLYDRVIKSFEALGDVNGKRILDVGSGSGRISVMLGQRGANVVGIDFAESMLLIAEQHAREEGVSDRVSFVHGDFMSYQPTEKFDAAIALGVFDYVKEPVSFLRHMGEVVTGRVIGSFPGRSLVRQPLRKIRYALRGCPLYFYSREDLPRIAKQAGFKDVDVVPYASSGFLLIASK